MSNDTNTMNTDKKSISYGAKLKAAREAMGLEQKDIAAQLRLGERIIDMLESGHYLADVPVTFVRGYIRSYSKLLQIPENEVAEALEPIQPTPCQQEILMAAAAAKQPAGLTFNNYYMQFSTYAIVATLTGMLGLWWYNHTPAQRVNVEASAITIADLQKPEENKQMAAATPTATPTDPATTPAASTPAATTATPTIAAATPAATKPAIAPKPKYVTREEDDDEDDGHN